MKTLKKILKTIGKSLISPVGIGLWAADAEFNNPVSDGTMTGHHKRKREDLIKELPKDMRKKLKTYNQFNESVAKALAKFGSKGLRKAAVKYAPKFKSTLKKLSTSKFEKKLLKKTVTGSDQTQSTAKNLLAKSQVSNPKNSGFTSTVKPLGSSTSSRVDTATKDLQFQGNLKGGEYKRRISGKGDKGPMGAVVGSRGSGNKSLRRSGQGNKITDYEKTGRKPTPMFRKTKAELSNVSKDPVTGKTEPHKWNPGDLYMQSVNIKQSKAHSRAIRQSIKDNQKRMANIKKGKGPIGMSEK